LPRDRRRLRKQGWLLRHAMDLILQGTRPFDYAQGKLFRHT
jgi:hypothetical protein